MAEKQGKISLENAQHFFAPRKLESSHGKWRSSGENRQHRANESTIENEHTPYRFYIEIVCELFSIYLILIYFPAVAVFVVAFFLRLRSKVQLVNAVAVVWQWMCRSLQTINRTEPNWRRAAAEGSGARRKKWKENRTETEVNFIKHTRTLETTSALAAIDGRKNERAKALENVAHSDICGERISLSFGALREREENSLQSQLFPIFVFVPEQELS